MREYILIIVLLFVVGCNSSDDSNQQIMKTVQFVDIDRFMGDWYVIANIPTFIEKRATNAVESYRLNDKGEVETTFTFYQDSPTGKKKVYNPIGFIFNTETNAEWRMQFIWPFKLPFLIIDLADDYSYTVVGVPNRKYVWIMARESKLSNDIYEKIINRLAGIGYDVSKVQKIMQEWK